MFLRGLNKLGRKELEREARGRPTLHSAVAHALFDIIDQNNNNQLTVRERNTRKYFDEVKGKLTCSKLSHRILAEIFIRTTSRLS